MADGPTEPLAEIKRLPTAQWHRCRAEPADTETERALAAILADVLEVGEVGRYDDFFLTSAATASSRLRLPASGDGGIPLTARWLRASCFV